MEEIIKAKFKKNYLGYIIGVIGVLITLIGMVEYFFAYTMGIWLVYIGILILVVFGIIILMMNRCELYVTNTRVIGKASFGKQVNLPIMKVTAIELGSFDRITVVTSVGRVNFWLVENRTEIYNALNELFANLHPNHH